LLTFRHVVSTAKFSVDTSPLCYELHIQGVSGGIVNILGGGSMDYSE